MRSSDTRDSNTISFLIENPDKKVQEQIRTALKNEYVNAQIMLIDDYTESLNRLIEFGPDIFIVDIDTDHIGTQLVRLANMLKLNAKIVVTGNNNVGAINDCISMGVKGYVIKPISNQLLIKTINHALAGIGKITQ